MHTLFASWTQRFFWGFFPTYHVCSEAEPLEQERPMTSFYDSLSEEQKARLEAYEGEEAFGDPEYRINPAKAA